MPKHASDITNGIEVVKPPPGIEVGGERHRRALLDQHSRRRIASQLQEERRRRQQRGDDVAAPPACARATRRRRSGDPPIARRLRRRRVTPPLSASSSAWMRAFRPCRWPASRMSRDSSGVNTPCSQNTSHHSASCSVGNRRDHLVDHHPHVVAAPAAKLDRHLVRAHERGGQLDRLAAPPPSGSRAACGARTPGRGRSRSWLRRWSCRRPASPRAAPRADRPDRARWPRAWPSTVLTMPPPEAAISA